MILLLGETDFHKLISPHTCYFCSKIAIIPSIFDGKHVKFFEIGLETGQNNGL